jgi:hypothetical protein
MKWSEEIVALGCRISGVNADKKNIITKNRSNLLGDGEKNKSKYGW